MQCGVEERVVRSTRTVVVRCFKCGEEGHKCRECPLWEKVQEGEKRLRRAEEGEAACSVKREAQQEWKRSSWEVLRKRAEWYCGPTVPQDAELWELEWCGQGAVVTYLKYSRCGEEGCHVEDDQGQGVVPYWKREKINWCGCKGKEIEGSTPTERKSAARVEKAAHGRENQKAQQERGVVERRSGEPSKC